MKQHISGFSIGGPPQEHQNIDDSTDHTIRRLTGTYVLAIFAASPDVPLRDGFADESQIPIALAP